jgi:hypothetical protein
LFGLPSASALALAVGCYSFNNSWLFGCFSIRFFASAAAFSLTLAVCLNASDQLSALHRRLTCILPISSGLGFALWFVSAASASVSALASAASFLF